MIALIISLLLWASSAEAIILDPQKWVIGYSSLGIGTAGPQFGFERPLSDYTAPPLRPCKPKTGPNVKYSDCITQYNAQLTQYPPQTWYFYFPKKSQDGHVNYIYSQGQNISGAQSITMRVRMTKNSPRPIFDDYQDGGLEPNVRLMFGYRIGVSAYERWWSNPTTIFLADGEFEVTVPLTPDRWSSVYGAFGDASPAALAGFQDAVSRQFVFVGMTFGGGSFFGHGVRLDDTQPGHEGDEFKLELLKYEINY